jgi:hypothetical protein
MTSVVGLFIGSHRVALQHIASVMFLTCSDKDVCKALAMTVVSALTDTDFKIVIFRSK